MTADLMTVTFYYHHAIVIALSLICIFLYFAFVRPLQSCFFVFWFQQRRFSENREWENDENRTLHETIELEVECHNGDLSQSEAITSLTPLTTSNANPNTVITSTAQVTTACSNNNSNQATMHSIQQQQQPILQQPQLKHPAPKLTNLPTLSISGPHYETDEIL